jgi:hypothetical protein
MNRDSEKERKRERETYRAQQSRVQGLGYRALCNHPLFLGLDLNDFRSLHTLLHTTYLALAPLEKASTAFCHSLRL